MSAEPATLRQGREAAAERRRREAIARVTAYMAWCKAHGPMSDIPPVPSSADFRLARGDRR